MNIIDHPSPNFGDRLGGLKAEMIIIHYTGMISTTAALKKLCDPKSDVSCHYLIDEAGKIYKLVDEKKRAWHAGAGAWRGKGDINSRSIGIELSNRGNDPYPKAQIKSLITLCKDIMRRCGIKPAMVQGHSDIAPDRKKDPGHLFPWKKLARHGVGVWPSLSRPFKIFDDEKKLAEAFRRAGYPVGMHGTLEQVIVAFQRHYEPNKIATPQKTGKVNAHTLRRLQALIKKS